MSKYGFVYIWYDRKRKMYYIGSHWGTKDDGYICSSVRMKNAHKKRPNDFKRRIISIIYTNRIDLLNLEQSWLDQVKRRDLYYNLHWKVRDDYWWADPHRRDSISKKLSEYQLNNSVHRGRKRSKTTKDAISASKIGKKASAETKAILSKAHTGKFKTYEYTNKDGVTYIVSNLKKFTKENNLDYTTMCRLAQGNYGNRTNYKGWSFVRFVN